MRADVFLATRYGSRSKAAQALNRGEVLRKGRAVKPSDALCESDVLTFLEGECYVSEGGYKLSRALSAFPVAVRGKVFADLGASTGGFTDCLLQNGAKRVYAVDVGESLLDPSLAADGRVVQKENTNARFLSAEDFPEPIDGVVTDVSFISLACILPAVAAILGAGGLALLLIKPQFECGKGALGKSGIVRDGRLRLEAVERICALAKQLDLAPKGIVNAPLREKKNIEYVVWLEKGGVGVPMYEILKSAEDLR